jgi:hypothetical protein
MRTPRALAQRLPTTVPEDSLVKEPAEVHMDASGVLQWPSGISGLSGSTTGTGAARVSKYDVVDTGGLSSVHTLLSQPRSSNGTADDVSASKYELLRESAFNTLDGGSETPLTSITSGKLTFPSYASQPTSEGTYAGAPVGMHERSGTETAFATPAGSVRAGDSGPVGKGGKIGDSMRTAGVRPTWTGMGLFGETSEASVEVVETGHLVEDVQSSMLRIAPEWKEKE